MKRAVLNVLVIMAGLFVAVGGVSAESPARIRVATFNVALNRRAAGQLMTELRTPDQLPARQIAEIVQRVRPDVLLLNEFDFDPTGAAAGALQNNYLAVSQNQQQPIHYEHVFAAAVNTGESSGLDLDQDGKTNGPGDAFGFGYFPGQYGMLVLSRFPIQRSRVRTFRTFLWRAMPDALRPVTPDGKPYYTDEQWAVLRLSSKSHWDLPLDIGRGTLHWLCAHPTPPVFDGPEDRNGRRNHDEIRLWADYIDPQRSGYLVADDGRRGGLPEDGRFIIAGDLNADPVDGDSTKSAIQQLLAHRLINSSFQPTSRGATKKAEADGGANRQHQGPAEQDTTDFDDRNAGNLRLDYVLPSKNLKVLAGGVFWPSVGEPGHNLVQASDHRLVWLDVEL